MNTFHTLIRIVCALSTALLLSNALAQSDTQTGSPSDTVARDPATGDWIYNFYHPTEPNRSYAWRYTPRNQIKPAVRSSVHWDGKAFEYRYQIRNAKEAKQTISYIWLRAPIQITEVPTTDEDVDMKVPQAQWMAALDKRYDARNALRKRTVLAASGWDTQWHINRKDFIEFGWFPDIKDDTNLGMKPGVQQGGFGILRPELPGLAFAKMKGDVPKPEILGGTPSTGAVAAAISQMQEEDSTWTHVMVPAIAVPAPWDGAELARRIKAHAQNWVKWQAMTPAMLSRLNPKFDALIAAQESKDIRAIHQASVALMTEVFLSQRGMHHGHASEDEDGRWQTPIPIVRTGGFPALFPRPDAQPDMERIAARALVFDVIYLLTRSHMGR
jgi:hypothetical protein